MKATIIKQKINASISLDGILSIEITKKDNSTELITLEQIPFAKNSRTIHNELSKEEQAQIHTECDNMIRIYLEKNNIKTEEQIKKEAEDFIESIRNGTRTPDFIGVFGG